MRKNTSGEQAYSQKQEFRAHLRGREITFWSKPGLPNWDRVTPGTQLLADGVDLTGSDRGRVLVLECGHGAGAAALALSIPDSEFVLLDVNWVALQMASQTLRSNEINNFRVRDDVSILPAGTGSFDLVVMELPKGRKLAQRRLLEAYGALRPGRALYLAGANDQGIQPIIKDAAGLFEPATILKYKKGNRLARLVRPVEEVGRLPEWAGAPGIAPGSWIEFDIELQGDILHLRSLPGVFSAGEVDEGTRLLLEQVRVPLGGRVLDVGCGYGLIGLWAARSGAGYVDFVDSNLLAVASAQENISSQGFSNCRVFPGDALSSIEDGRYDAILTNPPFHAGKGVETNITGAIIAGARRSLAPGGVLWLVANRFLRYEEWIQPLFSSVQRVAETGKYIVWKAEP